jgi:hypothetical protein
MAKEVAKVEPTALAEQVPDFMKADRPGLGTEGLSATAFSPPRLKMAQALSPELEDMDDLKPGMFFNSALGKVYGSSVRIIPCYLSEAYFLFTPRVPGATGGLLARANDGIHWDPSDMAFEVVINKAGAKAIWKTKNTVMASGLAAWGTSDPSDKNSPPAATYAINCVALCASEVDDGPAVLSFTRSAVKVGKKFAGNLGMSRVPSFGRMFDLTSLKVDGTSGPYYEPRLKPVGFVTDQKIYELAKNIYSTAKKLGVLVDIEKEVEPPSREETRSYENKNLDDQIPY